jgi:hypothetical protein
MSYSLSKLPTFLSLPEAKNAAELGAKRHPSESAYLVCHHCKRDIYIVVPESWRTYVVYPWIVYSIVTTPDSKGGNGCLQRNKKRIT